MLNNFTNVRKSSYLIVKTSLNQKGFKGAKLYLNSGGSQSKITSNQFRLVLEFHVSPFF
jgi:hypothetical protein